MKTITYIIQHMFFASVLSLLVGCTLQQQSGSVDVVYDEVNIEGIVLGKTTENELIDLWGYPNESYTKVGRVIEGSHVRENGSESPSLVYTVLYYRNGTQRVWILDNTVMAIMQIHMYSDDAIHLSPERTLKSWTQLHGRPSLIFYGDAPRYRCLIWPQAGLLTQIPIMEDRRQAEIMLDYQLRFAPMESSDFLNTPYPWPNDIRFGCSSINHYLDGDAPDLHPLDPYNWVILTGKHE